MRLIDADAFEKTMTDKILPMLIKKYGEEEAVKGLHFSFQDCISNIQGEPTIEPQRKKGKWIDDCSCSVCYWTHEDDKGFALVTDYSFCPNCGADMGGGIKMNIDASEIKMNIDADGTLWVDVEEVCKVNRVIVTEPKSKFCKVFCIDPIPETQFTPSEEFYGYNVAHLAMVASMLNDHHLTPDMIAYMCTDIAITYDTVIELIRKQSIDSIMNYIMKGEND